MPHHTEDEFCLPNKYLGKSKYTKYAKYTKYDRRSSLISKEYHKPRSQISKESDFILKIKKEKIKFPDTIPYSLWIRKNKDFLNTCVYGDLNSKNFSNECMLYGWYLKCGICGHFTKTVKTCDECSGEFNICSSHKYRNCNLCMECGIKCKLCKNYSSMRFENPLNPNSNKRQLPDQYKKIDLCCYCVDRLSIHINNITLEKYITSMIIQYIKE